MKFLHSLQFRLIALLLLLSLISTAFRLGYVLPSVRDQLQSLVADQQWSAASYIADDIDHAVRARRAQLTEMAGTLTPELLRDPAALSRWLGDRQRLTNLFDMHIDVYAPNGSRLASTAGTGPAYGGDRDWFDAALHSDDPVFGRPYQSNPSNESVLPMAIALRDTQRKPVAVIAGVSTLASPAFLGRVQKIPHGATGGFLVVSPHDKLFLASSKPEMVMRPTPPVGTNLMHDRAMNGYRGSGVTINAFNVEEIVGIASVPAAGWFVVARMPTVEAMKPAVELRDHMMRTTLIAIIAIGTVLLFFVPRILGPLRRASQKIREMADGSRELAPIEQEGRDEVGGLVSGFNHLVARLREKEAELKASEAGMQFLAHHDPLTGLFNRTVLQDRLEQALARGERNHSRFALLFFDLDGFKEVNDVHGHHVGDAVLVQVAARLSEGRRRTDTVARLGGDEFVILLADLDGGAAQAMDVARHSVVTLAAPYRVDQHMMQLSASAGVAMYAGEAVTASQLLTQADMAMYLAKREGKNRACLYEAMS